MLACRAGLGLVGCGFAVRGVVVWVDGPGPGRRGVDRSVVDDDGGGIAPFVTWVDGAAAQAEEAAAQAKLAVGAYEAAFAATVPPPIIAANRALLAALVATSALGAEHPRDRGHRNPLPGRCGRRTQPRCMPMPAHRRPPRELTPFTEPPQTTNTAGTAAQAAAASLAGTRSQYWTPPRQLSQLDQLGAGRGCANLATTLGVDWACRRTDGESFVGTRSATDIQLHIIASGTPDRPDQLEHHHVHHCLRVRTPCRG